MENPKAPSTTLSLAIIQAQDSEEASKKLKEIHAIVLQLPSTGGFLGVRNSTFLIGSAKQAWHSVIEVLRQTCKQRVEFIPVPVSETMMANNPLLTQVSVGGATVFSLDVEHYEEI